MARPYSYALGCLIWVCFLILFSLVPFRELERDIFCIYSITHRQRTKYWNPWHQTWRHRLGSIQCILKQIDTSDVSGNPIILGNYEIPLIAIPFHAVFSFHLC